MGAGDSDEILQFQLITKNQIKIYSKYSIKRVYVYVIYSQHIKQMCNAASIATT